MKNKDKKLFFSAPEVAKILNVSRVTIASKIKRGIIKAEKVGGIYLIPKEGLESLLDNGDISKEKKEEVKIIVRKIINEYGEAIKLLGKE
ncbi:MAG: helix-turn-helix domain-containing protein [Candidatus Paceibacterota bacterium]|jgi:excisionase family DNA binding protein